MRSYFLYLSGIALLQVALALAVFGTEQPSSRLEENTPTPLHGIEHATLQRPLLKTAFRSTIGSIIRHPLTTYHLGITLSRRRGATLFDNNLPTLQPTKFLSGQTPRPGSPEFELHLDRAGLPSRIPGELSYHIGGREFFAAFEKELTKARHSVDSQVYIFDNDDVGVRCADLLRARAEKIPVRVIFDDLGSTMAHGKQPPSGLPQGFIQPADIGAYLIEENSNILLRETLNPWLITDHTKLHIFDRKVAFLGGMNLGRESRHEWHDLMVSVTGPVVDALSRDYDQTWRRNGPLGDFALFVKPQDIQFGEELGSPLRLLRTDVLTARNEIVLAMQQAIRGASTRVWIEMPYFSSDTIETELKAAASRGVDVRLILPERANHQIMDAGNSVTARNLLNAGVRVYHYPGMTHLKAMVCDGWATVGSANLDTISLHINRELNISFSDSTLVSELVDRVFEPDFQKSSPLTLKDIELKFAPLIESITDQL
ncbi:MAG: phosphatidylserine/phosphatidylglycerophosphate/cardiolipin synthase family protein [Roseibacillus sp.]